MTIKMKKSESGFTLVELAIVMIIVGLLIGGVLKGQAMIDNQRINSTVAQIKAMDAATTTFRDMYNAMPGDMLNSGTRLPNCTGGCVPTASLSNGNGRVDEVALGAITAATTENGTFFSHLAAADLLGGITPGGAMFFGQGVPSTTAGSGNGFLLGYRAAGDLTAIAGAANAMGGHYLALTNNATAALTTTVGQGLTQAQAFRIDSKMDDGAPDRGNVIAFGTFAAVPTAINCGTPSAVGPPLVVGTYAESFGTIACGLYIRFQN